MARVCRLHCCRLEQKSSYRSRHKHAKPNLEHMALKVPPSPSCTSNSRHPFLSVQDRRQWQSDAAKLNLRNPQTPGCRLLSGKKTLMCFGYWIRFPGDSETCRDHSKTHYDAQAFKALRWPGIVVLISPFYTWDYGLPGSQKRRISNYDTKVHSSNIVPRNWLMATLPDDPISIPVLLFLLRL